MAHSIVDPDSLGDYLAGVWKRNLEWRHFGPSFQFMRSTNSVMKVDKYKSTKSPGSVFLQLSFGRSLSDIQFGYVIKVSHSKDHSSSEDSTVLSLQWQYSGEPCTGYFHTRTGTLTLNFILKGSTNTFTYRIIDDNTMSVAVVEVGEDHTPTFQYGQALRINLKKYAKQLTQFPRRTTSDVS